MLKVNEIFGPTIQGEGPSVGREVMFVRLALCNLYCIWCDTPYTWNWLESKYKHPNKYDYEKEVHSTGVSQILQKLLGLHSSTRSVVVSGGEPLIQQKELVELVLALKNLDYWIEIETNGTFIPSVAMFRLVDQFNCSPKLENSTCSKKERERPKALIELARSEKTCFKFVVSSEKDIEEILFLVGTYEMKRVYLMPEGRTREELDKREEVVKNLCSLHGFTFSPRLHIIQFGARRGV